jgi:hypothetical protein
LVSDTSVANVTTVFFAKHPHTETDVFSDAVEPGQIRISRLVSAKDQAVSEPASRFNRRGRRAHKFCPPIPGPSREMEPQLVIDVIVEPVLAEEIREAANPRHRSPLQACLSIVIQLRP